MSHAVGGGPKESPISRNPLARAARYSSFMHFFFLLALALLLMLGDYICYQFSLPIELDEAGGLAQLRVGSEHLALGSTGGLVSFQLALHDPIWHEYQMDGTDSTNNHTLDSAYFASIASTPYYRFQAWMRNLDGTSRWSDLHIYASGKLITSREWPANGFQAPLPSGEPLRVSIALRRPETPMTLMVITQDRRMIQITVDRNNRKIEVTSLAADGQVNEIANVFFPVDALPFIAMILDTLIRILLWALAILALVLLCGLPIAIGYHLYKKKRPPPRQGFSKRSLQSTTWIATRLRGHRDAVLCSLHPVALVGLLASFGFVSWIAAVQYNGEPHIYDAGAYLFAAKMYALGHLAVPVPPASDRFPGPFIVQFAGQWFAQYPPGTGLTLVPGIWLGIPWLVEPVLGTLALLGCGLLAARLYNRRVATLTVLLGAASPFYSYLSASYLSHTVMLFYFVWGIFFFVRFLQKGAGWNMPVAAVLFGMATLTRDTVSVFYVGATLLGILLVSWPAVRHDWRRWIGPMGIFLSVALVFLCITLEVNTLLTHKATLSPRLLFFSGDHWGFGQDVGFYGQHTFAAGLVNLDELLTILCIDLYGWPFYLSLAWLTLPFLLRKALKWDWLFLALTCLFMGAYIGYFYHGIYLGPRYFFETLPFLLILTARGILVLASLGNEMEGRVLARLRLDSAPQPARWGVNIPVALIMSVLLFCNLLYFLPRQMVVYNDFSGMPYQYHLKLAEIYHPPLHNAVVVTDNYMLYQFVLFPLNDPYLKGDVIYALGGTIADYQELHRAFPQRTLVRLDVAADGSVEYTPLTLFINRDVQQAQTRQRTAQPLHAVRPLRAVAPTSKAVGEVR